MGGWKLDRDEEWMRGRGLGEMLDMRWGLVWGIECDIIGEGRGGDCVAPVVIPVFGVNNPL